MKTNIIYKLTLGIFLCMSIISCEDFLDIAPESSIGVENFFQTDTDFELALNGTYSNYTELYMLQPTAVHLQLAEGRSDNFLGDPGVSDFLVNGASAFYSFHFNAAYVVIFQCNQILERIDGIEFTSEELKDQIKGQAHFIRAQVYFELVRLYGGMPLVLEETTSFDEADINIPRSSLAETYAQIESDLATAKQLLPPTWPDIEKGRATSVAASVMLGKVYLQNGNSSAALTELQAAKTLADANGHGLVTSHYADIFNSGNGNNKEIIHAIQCYGNNDIQWYFLSTDASSVGPNFENGSNSILPTDSLLASFEPGDSRFDTCFFVDVSGQAFMYKYVHSDVSRSDADFPILRYADLLLMLAEAGGENATSYGYINQVRSRAGLTDISASTPGTYTEKILQERRAEFFGEGQRWYDLLRLMSPDDLVAYMNDFLLSQGGLSPGGTFVALETYKLLHPLPNGVVEATEGIIAQNPGWAN